jgi:glucose/mannose-6-phosphate isomerase
MPKTSNIDKENLRQVILDSHAQFKTGFDLAENIKIKGDFSAICVSGMGGSALPTDTVRLYLDETGSAKKYFEILINRTYIIPKRSYKNCLHIVCSFSGNTEESLTSLKEIMDKKLPVIGIAHGGKLIETCKKHKIPCIELPFVSQPRYATGLFFSALLKILSNSGLIKLDEKDILAKAQKLGKTALVLENQGKSLAKKITGKTPIIYSADKFRPVAMIWKIKINENAKTPAFYNVYPELNHNEMVGWTLPQGKFHVITLADKNDHPRVLRRMRITKDLLKEKGIETTIVEMESGNIFSTMFSALLLCDWTSYYLALAYKQDPTPVKMVEDLKKMLT